MTQRLAASGHHVEVVTPRYGAHWSDSLEFHGMVVHRVAAAPKGEWSMQRYVRFMTNWMAEQANRFDAIVCDGINEDARAIITAIQQIRRSKETAGMKSNRAEQGGVDSNGLIQARAGRNRAGRDGTGQGETGQGETGQGETGQGRAGQGRAGQGGKLAVPLGITLCNGWGSDADEVWCRQARGGKRSLSAVAEMDWVVTRHAGADRFLVAHDVPGNRIHRIRTGFSRTLSTSTNNTAELKAAARVSLGTANLDLATTDDDRVLLWCGHMRGRPRDNTGVATLVANARLMCGRYSNLRIWLLGDGEMHDWVHTELKAEGVRSVVAVPGSFADMTDIWRAVDYAVITDDDQLRHHLPTAIGCGIPVLLDEKPPIRAWVNEHFESSIADSFAWYDHHVAASLRKTFRMLWDDMPTAIEHAKQVALHASLQSSDTEELRHWSNILQRIPPDHERRVSTP